MPVSDSIWFDIVKYSDPFTSHRTSGPKIEAEEKPEYKDLFGYDVYESTPQTAGNDAFGQNSVALEPPHDDIIALKKAYDEFIELWESRGREKRGWFNNTSEVRQVKNLVKPMLQNMTTSIKALEEWVNTGEY